MDVLAKGDGLVDSAGWLPSLLLPKVCDFEYKVIKMKSEKGFNTGNKEKNMSREEG
jgi:hypothetical protein